jgi:hypothetical protein
MNVFRDPNHAIIDTKMDESLHVGKAVSVTYHMPPSSDRSHGKAANKNNLE